MLELFCLLGKYPPTIPNGEKMRRAALSAIVIALVAQAVPAFAMPSAINSAVLKDYDPAVWNRSLETAYVDLDMSKLHTFVVVENGGIPAERARFFVTWSDYDYRGVVVHVDEDDRITTRRGRPYAYLQRGDVMAVAGIKYFNKTIYLKLISAEVYVPSGRKRDKRHSRVTVMLGFKFPKNAIASDDADAVIAEMKKWVMPFPNFKEAEAFARGIRNEGTYLAEEEGEIVGEVKVADSALAGAKIEDEKVKSLEEKIEKVRQDLLDAEKELQDIKKDKK